MHTDTIRARLARAGLALALATGLAPALAHADENGSEPAADEGVVALMAASAARSVALFEATGDASLLQDATAYEPDGAPLQALDAGDTLPASFDLRDEGVVTPVKFQNPWGTCWSFAAIAASETSIMSELGLDANEGDEPVDLSELHTAWFSYLPLPADAGPQAGEGIHTPSVAPSDILDQGGMPFTATSVFSSGIGPVPEEDAPYRNKEGLVQYGADSSTPYWYAAEGDWSVDESQRFLQALELEESRILPSPASRAPDGSYRYSPAGTEAFKRELLAGRAVAIGFCADEFDPGQPSSKRYLNEETWAHYTYEQKEITHAVTIVGWDDGYAKENFIAGHEPPHDGAFIVKNSWGAKDAEFPHRNPDGWGVDGSGYFYLSYYDMTIGTPESFDYDTEEYGEGADYYLIDQHDLMPSEGVRSVTLDAPVSMANVFEASERQRVRALSCETSAPNTTATLELYRLKDGYENPRDGELLATVRQTFDFGGYHRIRLDDGFVMEAGQPYAVVATEQHGGGYEVLTDSALNEAGSLAFAHLGFGSSYAVGVVNEGESFLLEDGVWSDWADDVAELKQIAAEEHRNYYDYDNFALKAYADPVGEPANEPSGEPDAIETPETEEKAEALVPDGGGETRPLAPTGDNAGSALALSLAAAALAGAIAWTGRRRRS